MEAIWIEIISYSQRLLIGAVYRHPNDHVKFFDKFRNTLEKIWMKRKHLVILRDLNSDLNLKGKNKDKEESYYGRKLSGILKHYNLYNIINRPTRIMKETETTFHFVQRYVKSIFMLMISQHLLYVIQLMKQY